MNVGRNLEMNCNAVSWNALQLESRKSKEKRLNENQKLEIAEQVFFTEAFNLDEVRFVGTKQMVAVEILRSAFEINPKEEKGRFIFENHWDDSEAESS